MRIIPLDLNIKKEVGKTIQINTTKTLLLIVKDQEGNVISGNIVGIESNQAYTDRYIANLIISMMKLKTSYNPEFTGTIALLRIDKSLLLESNYVQGKYRQRELLQKGDYLIGTAVLTKKESGRNTTINSAPSEGACTDYYWVTYDVQTGEILSVTYEYSICNGGTGGGGGGGAVPITEWGTSEAGLLSPHLCNTGNTFNFATIGNGYTGEIEDLGMSLVGPGGQFMNIEFGPTYLSIPKYNISSSYASSLFVQAYNAGVDDVLIGLNDGTIPARATIIKQTFKERIVSRLQALKSGSSMSTGSGCSGSVPASTAHYC